MRVFLSAYSGFTLAIPMDDVGAMMLYKQKTEKTIHYDQKNRCTFISLPWLFNMRDVVVPHGIILREFNSKENKVVILTGEIKRDIEIPDDEFYPIPKTLSAMKFSTLFKGIKFSDKPILLLNMKQLPQILQNEYQAASKKPFPVEQAAPKVIPKPAPLPPPQKVFEEPPVIPVVVSKPAPPPPPEKVIEEPPVIPVVVSKPVPPPPPKEVFEEPPIIPVVVSKPPPPPPPEKVIEEPPVIPVVVSKPAPPPPPEKVIEEPPVIPVVVSKPAPPPPKEVFEETDEVFDPLMFDDVIEICDVFEEPPVIPVVVSKPAPTPPKEVTEESEKVPVAEALEATEAIEDSDASLMFDEVIEICEIIEEPPISSAVTSQLSTSTPDEVIEEPAEAPVAETLETTGSSMILDDVIEEPAEAPVDKALESTEVTEETDSSLTFDEVVEICDVIEEPPVSPSETFQHSTPTPDEVIVESAEASVAKAPVFEALVVEALEATDSSLSFGEVIEIFETFEESEKVSAPSSSMLDEVVEETVEVPVAEAPETTELNDTSLTIDEDIEICDIIEETPSYAVTSELSTIIPIEVIDESPEDFSLTDDFYLTFDEDNEIYDIFDDSPINPEATSEPSSIMFDEVVEICDFIDET
jgi:hypothetical protein